MLPLTAVGRTAGAVGGIADSGLMISMTRGRLWIAVLGLLLGGIVALNVWGLSLSASSAATATKIAELERENSVLRGRLANRLSSAAVADGASGLGLGVASPRALRYTKPGPDDAARAAERISAGELSVLPALPVAPELALAGADPATEAIAPVDEQPAPAADPAAGDVAPGPAEQVHAVEPAPTPPPAADPATAGGGIAP